MAKPDVAAYQAARSIAAEAARHARSGDRVRALAGLDEAVRRLSWLWSTARRAKDRRAITLDLGDVLLNAGQLRYLLGDDLDSAEQNFRQAQAAYESADQNEQGIVICLTSLGSVLRDQGRLDEAVTAHEEAFARGRRLGRHPAELAATVNQLGLDAFTGGDNDGARMYFGQARAALDPQAIQGGGLTTVLTNLALVEHHAGRLSDAADLLEESLQVMDGLADSVTFDWQESRAITLGNLGAVHADQGELEQALPLLREACTTMSRIRPGSLRTAVISAQFAHVLARTGDPQAVDWQRRAVDLARRVAPGAPETAHLMQVLAEMLGGGPESANLLQAAVAILTDVAPRSRSMVNALLAFASLSEEEGDAARVPLLRALEIGRSLGDPRLLAETLVSLGAVSRYSGDRAAAIGYLREALAIAETLRIHIPPGQRRSRLVTATVGNAHELLIEAFEAGDDRPPDHAERSFDVIESVRARALLDILDAREVSRPASPYAAATAALADLRERIDRAEQLDAPPSLRASLEEQRVRWQGEAERAARQRFRSSFERRTATPAGTLTALRAALPDDVLFVTYEQVGSAIYYWAVRSGGIRTGQAALAPSEVEALIEDDIGETEIRARLSVLLDLPAESLHGVRRLVVSPGGELHRLLFDVLTLPDGRPVSDALTTSYAPSAAVLLALRERSATVTGLGSFVGYSYGEGDEGHAALPAVESEVIEIAAAFRLHGEPGVAITGENATKERVLATIGPHRYVHFAAHACADDDEPAYSRIELAPAAGGSRSVHDALLTYELFELPLSAAELVVCSGCDTARGVVEPGEGLMGMAQGFFGAGSQWVVLTLWPVHDLLAHDLMSRFYSALRSMDVPAALAHAKRAVRRGAPHVYRDPRTWAAFVALGAALERRGPAGGLPYASRMEMSAFSGDGVTRDKRERAQYVLSYVTRWRLPRPEWARIRGLLIVLGEALTDDDGEAFARASADLELSSPLRIRTKLGDNDVLEDASPEVHDRVNRLLVALGGSGTEGEGSQNAPSADAE